MILPAPSPPPHQKASRQIGLLAALGIGTNVLLLGLVSLALYGMHASEKSLTLAQTSSQTLADALNSALSMAQNEQLAWLSDEAGAERTQDWPHQLVEALQKTRTVLPSPEVANALRELESSIPALESISQWSLQWNRTKQKNRIGLNAARARVDSNLREMNALLTSYEGRHQLKVSGLIRHFRALPAGPEANRQGRDIITQIHRNDNTAEFRTELASLTYVCERLLNEDRLDQLADYKDNLLSAPLFRLARDCANLTIGDSDFAAKLEFQLNTLKENLLGNSYRMDSEHQTIVLGTGGLFTLCKERILLEQKRTAFRKSFGQNLEAVHFKADRLQLAFNQLSHQLAVEAEAALSKAGQRTLALGLLCTAAFVIFSRKVAGKIARQIRTLEQANLALETIAHAAQQTSTLQNKTTNRPTETRASGI